MCTPVGGDLPGIATFVTEAGKPVLELKTLLDYARLVRDMPEIRNNHVGFIGFGKTKPGDKVLLAVDNTYAPEVVEAFAAALREREARVDILSIDAGPDREFDYYDEIRVAIRREPWHLNPRRWEGVPWVEELAERQKYDLLIHGKGGPTPNTSYRYEQLPWLKPDQLASGGTTFPTEVNRLINQKVWDVIWNKGRGGHARIVDPEGTDLSYTLYEEYYRDNGFGFNANPYQCYNHLFVHPTPPFIEKEDTTGVAAGTTSHYTRAFPQVQVTLEDGQITKVDGGGPYGRAWQEMLDEAKGITYPVYPRPGLFWLWEVALGTNPKIVRPSNIQYTSTGGFEWERRRSGVIHLGFGTVWRGPEEVWAAEQRVIYGHVHIHLLFPTMDLTTRSGEVIRIIDRGHLLALDDPDVRKLAAKYGDPDEILREDWIPQVPGITMPGTYADYAGQPDRWIYH